MGRFVKGDVVVVFFPFSDLSSGKKRPALVLVSLDGDDVVLCQITSQAIFDDYAIELQQTDFTQGQLSHSSFIRPNRLFTADQRIIHYRVGTIKPEKAQQVVEKIIDMLS